MKSCGSKNKHIQALLKKDNINLTLRDIKNIAKKGCKKKLSELVKHLIDDHNCEVSFAVGSSKNIKVLLVQDKQMKKTLEAYPEILFIDGTYKMLDTCNTSVYFVNAENSNGETEVGAIAVLYEETNESLDWLLDTLTHKNPVLAEKTRVVMMDKDAKERNAVSKHLPNAELLICYFHMKQIFHRKFDELCTQHKITNEEKVRAKSLIESLATSQSENEYQKTLLIIRQSLPSCVLEYFDKNWADIKDQWVCGLMKQKLCFLNLTNNRSEGGNARFKYTVPLYSDLETFLDTCFLEITSRRFQIDANASNMKLRIPTMPFKPDSPEEMYRCALTAYAFHFVLNELQCESIGLMLLPGFDDQNDFSVGTPNNNTHKVSSGSCSCNFVKSMGLPCRHIFFVRSHLQVTLYSLDLFLQRWSRSTYYLHCDPPQSNVNQETESEELNDCNVYQVASSRSHKTLSRRAKYKEMILLLEPLADIASSFCNDRYEAKKACITNLLEAWSQGHDVLLQAFTQDNVVDEVLLNIVSTDELESPPTEEIASTNLPHIPTVLQRDARVRKRPSTSLSMKKISLAKKKRGNDHVSSEPLETTTTLAQNASSHLNDAFREVEVTNKTNSPRIATTTDAVPAVLFRPVSPLNTSPAVITSADSDPVDQSQSELIAIPAAGLSSLLNASTSRKNCTPIEPQTVLEADVAGMLSQDKLLSTTIARDSDDELLLSLDSQHFTATVPLPKNVQSPDARVTHNIDSNNLDSSEHQDQVSSSQCHEALSLESLKDLDNLVVNPRLKKIGKPRGFHATYVNTRQKSKRLIHNKVSNGTVPLKTQNSNSITESNRTTPEISKDRNKSQDTTKSVTLKTFKSLSLEIKAKNLLSLFVEKDVIDNCFNEKLMVEENLIEFRTDKIPDLVCDEKAVKIDILKNYCSTDAFDAIKGVVSAKIKHCKWKCTSCKKMLAGSSIGCDLCLQWFHFQCANLLKKPNGNWFCQNCKLGTYPWPYTPIRV